MAAALGYRLLMELLNNFETISLTNNFWRESDGFMKMLNQDQAEQELIT